jgi:hypothetical protein
MLIDVEYYDNDSDYYSDYDEFDDDYYYWMV